MSYTIKSSKSVVFYIQNNTNSIYRMKKIILVIVFFSFMSEAFAQQEPQYTQYMYNMAIINPAYATETPAILNLGTLYRKQWVGTEGAPKTLSFFGHTPVGKNIEAGLSIVSDDIGEGRKKENNFSANVAYVLKINEKHRLSFGMNAGLTSFKTNFSEFRLGDTAQDIAFSENINSTFANIGAGLFYFTDQYYLGLSASNFLSATHLQKKNDLYSIKTQTTSHFYLTGGYVYQISSAFKIKPSFMVKTTENAPITLDLSANILFNERFELGVSHRFNDSVSALVNIEVVPNLRVGYSYDYGTSRLSQFNSGSHEIILLFDLDFLQLGRKYEKSSRFF